MTPPLPPSPFPQVRKVKRKGDDEYQRAYRDALLSLRAIPDPVEFARSLPANLVLAVASAIKTKPGCRVMVEHFGCLRELRQMGLADMTSPYLTAFGNRVRKAIREMLT